MTARRYDVILLLGRELRRTIEAETLDDAETIARYLYAHIGEGLFRQGVEDIVSVDIDEPKDGPSPAEGAR